MNTRQRHSSRPGLPQDDVPARSAQIFVPNEKLYLARGPHQGTLGTFVADNSADLNWVNMREQDGTVRSQPREWLERCPEGELNWPEMLQYSADDQSEKPPGVVRK